MKKTVKRIEKNKLEDIIEDKQIEGFSLEGSTGRKAELVKRGYGSALWHIILLFVTGWWLFGIPNILYIVYSWFYGSKEVVIVKIEE